VKWLLSELVDMDPDHERFDAKVTVLIENVRHHVEEEENEFFPKVRGQLGRNELADLGETLADAKKSAPTRPHPRMPDAGPANVVAGAITGVVDRVGDNLSGIAQGSVTAVQDLIARITGSDRPKVSPTGSSTRASVRRGPGGRHGGDRRRAGDGSHRHVRRDVHRQGGQGRGQGHGHHGEEVSQEDGQHRQGRGQGHHHLGEEVSQEDGQGGQGRGQGHHHLGEEVSQEDGRHGQACRHDDRTDRTFGDEEDGCHGQAHCVEDDSGCVRLALTDEAPGGWSR
jgi:hypothetical protein